MQTKAFEEAAGEGQAYKAAARVAGDLRGMLEGSTLINARNSSSGIAPCMANVPQARLQAHA